MRFGLSIVVLLAVAIGLALFPAIASQLMTIEVMGWHLEMKQGVFLALLLLVTMLVSLLMALVRGVIKGPKHLLMAWRDGGRKRQETKLRNALIAWANGEVVAKHAVGGALDIVPVWLNDALAALINPAQKGQDEEAPLVAALRGRQLSDASDSHHEAFSLAVRQQAVALWLELFPRSVLARQRALLLAEEGEDWPAVVALIDQSPRGVVIADSKPRKAKALLQLAIADPSKALETLRQAAKLADDDDIVIALAAAYRDGDDLKSARTVLLDGLDKGGSLSIARALEAQEATLDNPLFTLHMLDKRCRKHASAAQRWLLVMLSLQAEDSERIQHHLRLLKQMPAGNALAGEIEAQLHA